MTPNKTPIYFAFSYRNEKYFTATVNPEEKGVKKIIA